MNNPADELRSPLHNHQQPSKTHPHTHTDLENEVELSDELSLVVHEITQQLIIFHCRPICAELQTNTVQNKTGTNTSVHHHLTCTTSYTERFETEKNTRKTCRGHTQHAKRPYPQHLIHLHMYIPSIQYTLCHCEWGYSQWQLLATHTHSQ